jgi:hypothetical protein
VVVVFPAAVVVVVAGELPEFDFVLTAVVVVAPVAAAPVPMLAGVGVTESPGAAAVVVVVGADAASPWGGGTSVEALQICAYDGAAAGAGALAVSGSFSWNRHPSTSSEGLETDCSAGPSLA